MNSYTILAASERVAMCQILKRARARSALTWQLRGGTGANF